MESGPTYIQSIEEFIFPIVVFDRSNKTFECLGTGFFIDAEGWFVTANHVINNHLGRADMEVMGIQTINEKERHVRYVTHYDIHSIGDIVIAKLGSAHNLHANPVPTVQPVIAKFDFSPLIPGEKLVSFGYPHTTSKTEGTKTQFNFKYKQYTGQVIEKLEKAPWLNYPCYQTDIGIESGASGGPVFRDGAVVSIHTASFELGDDTQVPISYITPIDMLLDMTIMNSDDKEVYFRNVLQPANSSL